MDTANVKIAQNARKIESRLSGLGVGKTNVGAYFGFPPPQRRGAQFALNFHNKAKYFIAISAVLSALLLNLNADELPADGKAVSNTTYDSGKTAQLTVDSNVSGVVIQNGDSYYNSPNIGKSWGSYGYDAIINEGHITSISGDSVTIGGDINNKGRIDKLGLDATINGSLKNAGFVGEIYEPADFVPSYGVGGIDGFTNEASGVIGVISGGIFGDSYAYMPNKNENYGLIGEIKGGTFTGALGGIDGTGKLINKNGATINTISGGYYTHGLQNDKGGKIDLISGGYFGGLEFPVLPYIGASYKTLHNMGEIGTINGGTAYWLTNQGTIGNVAGNLSVDLIFDNKGDIGNFNGGNIKELENSGNITNIGGSVNIAELNNKNIGDSSSDSDDSVISTLGKISTISGGTILTLNNNGEIGTISGNAQIASLTNTGTISTLTLENGNIGLNADGFHLSGNGKVDNVKISSWNLVIDSNADSWNAHKKGTTNKAEIKDEIGGANEHIYVDSRAQITSWNITNGGIVLDIGSGAILGEMYSYDNIIAGSLNDGVNGSKLAIGTVQGVRLNKGEKGFSFELDATDSSGARALQGVTNSGMQRNITNQSIYNSVLSSNFGSVSVANNAQDLTIKHRAKAYAMAKFHNYYKSVATKSTQNQRYIKLTHNPNNKIFVSYANANELDSAESTQDSTHSIQSQNNAQDFANDSAGNYATAQHSATNDKRRWNVFLVPYVAHSSSKMDNSSDSNAFSAGLLGGIQVDLGTGGILGGYIGYGYDNNKLELSRSNMTSINHSVQIGVQHIKYFDLESNSSNATRWFIRGGIRANIDNPTLKSNDSNGAQNKAHLFSYGIGVHLSEGVEFKLPESSMYHKANLTPEFSLSYDKMIINTYDLGNDKYPRQAWNLPQVGVALKWQSYWNPYFYSTMLAGVKYNIINKQSIELIKAGNATKSAVSLPSAYGHLEISGTWIVEQFHEVSLSYAGIYFGGGSAKGVMNSLSLKWGYSF